MPTALGLIATLLCTSAPPQTPPIFQPGAPGRPPRTISAAEAVGMSRTGFTAEDVRFMQHMLVHHAQAVEMVALLRDHGADPTVRRLGERIAASQAAEMALMRDWLQSRAQPVAAPDLHAGHGQHADHGAQAAADVPLMPGMLSPARMQALAAARGPAFDRLFLEGMIQHHRGALDMVDALMAWPDAGEEPLLSDFLASVVADQSAEILRMQSLLSDLNPTAEDRP